MTNKESSNKTGITWFKRRLHFPSSQNENKDQIITEKTLPNAYFRNIFRSLGHNPARDSTK